MFLNHRYKNNTQAEKMTNAQKIRERIKEKNAKNKGKKIILTLDQNKEENKYEFPEQDQSQQVKLRREKKPSKYQEAVYFHAAATPKNIAVKSTAGSGKTYTLIEVSKLLPYGKKAIAVAFAKANVKDLVNKLSSAVQCSTMHSLGMKAIRESFPGETNVNDKKAIRFIEPHCNEKRDGAGKLVNRSHKEKWLLVFQVEQILKLVRATMTPLELDKIEALCEEYTFDYTEEIGKIVIKSVKGFYDYNDSDNHSWKFEIDFQDMIEHPVRHRNILMPQFDYVLIDEIQDLSELDHIFISRIIKPVTGRAFGFGDPRQSIYSFRGAKIDSFETFERRANTVTLPLSICYRCSKAIVANAKKTYNDIEPWEGAEEGVEPRVGKWEEIREGDYVLCRNTRPLIDLFFRLIEKDMKAYVAGKETEQGLLSLLSRFDGSEKTLDAYMKLRDILENIESKLKSKGKVNPKFHKSYILAEEKIQILKILFDKFDHVYEVEEFIKRVFDDDNREGVALMTIHRSKGLECDRVFVIEKYEDRNLIPSPYACTPNQLIQEKNLKFVADTRAKKELIYLHLKPEKK